MIFVTKDDLYIEKNIVQVIFPELVTKFKQNLAKLDIMTIWDIFAKTSFCTSTVNFMFIFHFL